MNSSTLRDRLQDYLPLPIIRTPSSIEPLLQLRKEVIADKGTSLWIKRDDEIGPGLGGNKGRMLAYVMADVLKKKATAVVTVGGVYSNHARITAMVARRLGLKCSLILNGEIPDTPNGNFYLNKLMNIEIHNVPPHVSPYNCIH